MRALADGTDADWDASVAQSPDGWFWHTAAWRHYGREYVGPRFMRDLSFRIEDGGRVVAFCPLHLERGTPFDASAAQFAVSGDPVPFPALASPLGASQRQRILEFYVDRLGDLAKAHDAQYVRVRVPSVAASHMRPALPAPNPLLRFGFTDLAYLTQIVDLRQPATQLWDDIRKGHRSDIKTAQQRCRITVWDAPSITPAKFREYQEMHRRDAGRVTRSQATFDAMRRWVERGHGILLEATLEGEGVAFALIIVYGKGAYYGSACRHPGHADLSAQHLIQWEAMQWLKRAGIEFYDLGLQQFGPQWFDDAAPKDVSISRYKRGFGGTTVPLLTAEFHYSRAHRAQAVHQRFQLALAQ